MLETVDLGKLTIDDYVRSAGQDVVDELHALAVPLRGVRVLHVNATAYGGGVAELLWSQVPLLRDLGLAAEWKVVTADETFFRVTKKIHNGLQGADEELTSEERDVYHAQATRSAEHLGDEYDLIVVHDPQPLALLQLRGKGSARWIWRCHIDTSAPSRHVWEFLRPYLTDYDAGVFTLADFVPEDFPGARIEIIPPAIDPESPKNAALDRSTARRILGSAGVEPARPLIGQVSRFDPWKDPLGVIAAYRLAREEFPGLRLGLIGSMARDDPEGWTVYEQVQAEAQADPQIHLLTNLTGIEVNAFQRLADVVIQKSIREGFGLVVSETLWKATPVVAGRVGGIPLQMEDGAGGFLVDSVPECAERTIELLRDRHLARNLGARGRELVRRRFLLPRLLADELRLYAALLATGDGGDEFRDALPSTEADTRPEETP